VCNDRLALWSRQYGLPSEIKAHFSTRTLVRTSPAEQAALFEAYVAAVFLEGNLSAVHDWLIPLVKTVADDDNILARAMDNVNLGDEGIPPPPDGQTTPEESRANGAGSLALFNEKAIKQGLKFRFDEEPEGEAHARRWRVNSMVSSRRLPPCGTWDDSSLLLVDDNYVTYGAGLTKKEAKGAATQKPEAKAAHGER
jgi:dsRNA-specific ribonuclease